MAGRIKISDVLKQVKRTVTRKVKRQAKRIERISVPISAHFAKQMEAGYEQITGLTEAEAHRLERCVRSCGTFCVYISLPKATGEDDFAVTWGLR